MNIDNLRQEYKSEPLDINKMQKNPLDEFQIWFNIAKEYCIEPNAMNLATVSATSVPSIRTVLLKELTVEGFVFYTNYSSNKAQDIQCNANVALSFSWLQLHRQICIQGTTQKIATEKAKQYFSSRPRDSQLGAWTSKQSSIIPNREYLMIEFNKYKEKFLNMSIPKPDFWGGYVVIPNRIEFWLGNSSRLHDRIAYILTENSWEITRLAP